MAKSKARFLAELLGDSGKVKESKSALEITGGKIKIDEVPTIPNSKLENSSITIAGESTALGASVSLNTGHITEHTDYKYYTDARVRAAISASGDLSYNSSTGVISFSASASPVISVNTQTGSVVLDTGDISESGNLYFTNARARSAISVSGNALSYNSSTGVITSNFEENPTFTGKVRITNDSNDALVIGSGNESITFGGWDTGASDIAGLLAGSNFGSLITGGTNGHVVIGLRDNDVNDSFSVVSGAGDYTTGTTYDKLAFQVDTTGITTTGNRLDVKSQGTILQRWYQGSTEMGRAVSVSGVQMAIGTTDAGILFNASSNAVYAWDVGNNSGSDNLLDLGISTRRWKDLHLGGNINVGGTVDGRDVAADGTKLDGIETGATADQTAAEILTAIKTVDGSGSGLDADLLDGLSSDNFFRNTANIGSTDANNLTVRGVYGNSNESSNQPFDNNAGTIIHLNGRDTSYRSQIFQYSSGGDLYVRGKHGSSASWSSWSKVWHQGNDGAGSGLDADTVDGISSGSFLRSDASDTATGVLTFNGTSNFNGIVNLNATTNFDASGQQITLDTDGARRIFDFTRNGAVRMSLNALSSQDGFNFDFTSGSNLQINGNRILTTADEGSGNGLDADTLDGLQGSSFLRSDANDTFTGSLTIDSGSSMGLRIEHDTFGQGLELHREDNTNAASIKFSNNSGTSGILFAIHAEQNLYWRKGTETTNRKIWHSGNDGASSGLDADLLDGQHGSYYLSANNFTGTLSNARLSSHLDIGGQIDFGVSSNVGTTYLADRLWISSHTTGQSDVPGNYYDIINLSSSSSHGIQIASGYGANSGLIYIRTRSDNNNAPAGAGLQAWNKIWHNNNDGSGSGLDADILDGQQGSYYLDYNNFTNKPTIPSLSGYATESYVDTEVSNLVDSAPGTLNTLNELAAALGDDANFSTTTATSLGNRLRIDVSNQGLSATQKTNALTNLGITATVAELNYTDGVTSNIQTQLNSKLSSFDITTQTDPKYLRSNADDTATGNITITGSGSKALTVGNGSARREIKVNSSQWPEVTFYNASTENVRIGSAQTSSTYNTTEGDFYVYAPSTNKMNLIVPEDGGSFTRYNGAYTIWDSGNDGSGSGLDADTLDGINSGSFLRSDANDTYTGTLSVAGTIQDSGDSRRIHYMYGTTNSQPAFGLGEQGVYGMKMRWDSGIRIEFDGFWNTSVTGARNRDLGSIDVNNANWEFPSGVTINGSTAWHAGNDGSGSGLDADTVDGIHGGSFLRSDASDSGASSAANYLSLGYLHNTKLLIAAGTTSFTDQYNDSPWYGIGRTNVAGYNGTGYNTAQMAFYWGLTLRTAQARIDLSPASNGPITFGNGGTTVFGKITSTGIYQGTSNLVWHAGNDGAGSGLDADTLDGQQGTNYKRNNDYGSVAEFGPWYSTSTYVYDSTNGTRYFWLLLGTIAASSCKGSIEYEAKDDENYPNFVKGTIAYGGFNSGTSFSVQHDQHTQDPFGVQVRLDTSRRIWIRIPNCDWAHYFRFRVHKQTSNFTVNTSWSTGSTRYDTATTAVPPNSSSDILGGQNLRATSSSVTGSVPSYNNVNNFGGIKARGNIAMDTGASSGKFAVMSSAVHASYDFYNNGTTYLNGAVIIDDALDLTGGNRALKIAGTTRINSVGDFIGTSYYVGSTNIIDTSRNLSNINSAVIDHLALGGSSGDGGEDVKLGGIRGRFSGEHIQLYRKVGIGFPNGWNGDNASTPDFGIATYGGANLAYNRGTVNITTGSLAVSDAGTRGLVFDGNYTNGQYRHRFRKQDPGAGLPLYIDYAHGTANSFTNIARFGGGGTYKEFSVYGDQEVSGTTTYGPNPTWGKYLKIGGDANHSNANQASIGTTNGNLHIDAATSFTTYLNYYDGTGGVAFGSGGTAIVAWMGPDGDLWKGGADNSGSKYWHAGNDGAGSGLDADTLDGINSASFLRLDSSSPATQSIPANKIKRFYSNDALDTGTGSQSSLEVFQDTAGADAFMTFHVSGDYAAYFGLDGGTNDLAYGGWSKGANSNKVWHAGNDGSGSGLDADTLDGQHASAFVTTSTSSLTNYIPKGGSWYGTNFPGSRWNGFSVNGGEIVFARDNPNNGQMSILIDGAYYAGENNGFYSIYSGNNYNNKVGFYGDGSGNAQFSNAGPYFQNNTPYGFIQIGPMNTSHAHIYTDRNSFYYNKTLLYANGNTMWHAGNDGSGSGLDADNLDGSTWSTQTKNVAWRQGTTEAGNNNGIGFWGNTSGAAGSYAIYMSAHNGTYGGRVTGDANNQDYNMYFKMSAGSNRGFVFKNGSTNVFGIDGGGRLQVTGDIYGKAVANQYSNLYRFGGLYLGWDNDNYGVQFNHSITSGFGSTTLSDDITINSYNRIRMNIDTNNNNSNEVFQVGIHTTGSGNTLMTLANNGNFSVTGNVTAYSSDKRLKKNFKKIDNALDKVLSLNGYNFDWRMDKLEGTTFKPDFETNDVGLIAQEVEAVCEQATGPAPFDIQWDENNEHRVSQSGEDYLTVNYDKLVPVLVEAIKEQQETIEEQKNLINRLEERLNKLEENNG